MQNRFSKLLRGLFTHPFLWIFLIFLFYPFFPYLGNFTALGTELLTWFIFTLSFNLVLGYTGLPSFGHGAFYGLGTYGAAIAYLDFFGSGGFIVPIIIGSIIATVFAAVYGWVIRDKFGIYFALLTVVLTQVLYFIAFRWDEVTGGETGLTGISRGNFLGFDMAPDLNFYYFVFAVFVLCAVVIRRIAKSPFGQTLKSIKQNPTRATCLGYNVSLYKWAVFTISAFFGGLAGGIYCFIIHGAFASILQWTKSGDVVMATLLGGGMVSFYGPIIGSTVFIFGRELLSAVWQHWLLAYGLIFVIVILTIPTGIMGLVKRYRLQEKFRAFVGLSAKSEQ